MKPIRLSKVKYIKFIEVENGLNVKERECINAFWKTYSKTKPYLFNGKILAIESVKFEKETAVLKWYQSTYAHYLMSKQRVSDVQNCCILYCSIILETTNGNIVLGKMSSTTSTAGKILLPGGNVELENGILDNDICKQNAVRELKEEIGFELFPENLQLLAIKSQGKNGEVGLFFKSKQKYNEVTIRSCFNKYVSNNKETELSKMYFAKQIADFSSKEQNCFVDYLPRVFQEIKVK